MSRETISPSAATTFINIGERTNVTGETVMLGLVPSIQRAAKEGGSGMRCGASSEFLLALPVSTWILGTSPRMTLGGARA